MTFTEATKRDADEKFQQLDAGTTPSPITTPKMDSFFQYEQKSKKFHERISQQDVEIKRAFDAINVNKSNRIAGELAAKKKAADEAKAREQAEAERQNALLVKRAEASKRKKSIVTISAICIIAIALVLTIVLITSNLNKARYSEDNIVITVTDKAAESYVLKMDFENKSTLGIEYMQGILQIYDIDGNELVKTRIDFNGEMESGEKRSFTLDIDTDSKDFYKKSIKYMSATFQLEAVTYDNGEKKEYSVKPVSVLDLEVSEEPNPFENISVGSEIEFGHYEMNTDFDDGYEDISWIVVNVEGNKACLISKYSIMSMPFAPVGETDYASWAQSDIRRFLNGKFYTNAFNDEEKNMILASTITPTEEEQGMGAKPTTDKVFIPSSEELESWFATKYDMQCYMNGNIYSDYSEDGVGSTSSMDYNSYGDYWLRDAQAPIGGIMNYPTISYYDQLENDIYGTGFDTYSNKGIRPVIWIDLSKVEK